MSKKLKVLFLGTPEIALPTIEFLNINQNIELIGVVTMPDRPKGRGHKLTSPPVGEFAKQNNIKLFQTENLNKDEKLFKSFEKPDLIIVFAFAQFLGKQVLDWPSIGCFNIHTSLLPKYRGAAPIQYALLNGDKETGVSIQKMVKKMDAGDIVQSENVKIEDDETGGTLYNKLMKLAPLSLEKFILNVIEKKISYTAQDENNVSFAPTLKKADGLLNFKEKKYPELRNQVRALQPWPGTYCYLNEKRLKVFKVKQSQAKLSPGKVQTNNGFLEIGLAVGSVRLLEIQLEGKKACSDVELLNGLRGEIEINPNI